MQSEVDSQTSYRDLQVCQLSMCLVERLFELSARMPSTEFDLRHQMPRAAVSIPANVAEGYRRRRRAAYQNHVSIALGSQGELETRSRLLFGSESEQLCDRAGVMLSRLYDSWEPR